MHRARKGTAQVFIQQLQPFDALVMHPTGASPEPGEVTASQRHPGTRFCLGVGPCNTVVWTANGTPVVREGAHGDPTGPVRPVVWGAVPRPDPPVRS